MENKVKREEGKRKEMMELKMPKREEEMYK